MAKRIAQITLPETDNDGASLVDQHTALKRTLLTTWGGYTSVAATGAWVDGDTIYEEDVIVYSIAMDDNDSSSIVLRKLAEDLCQSARQLAVAIVLPTGEFQIIEPRVPDQEELSATRDAMHYFHGDSDDWRQPENM